MNLNNQLPGLPEWPPIVQDNDAYVVGGPHVSYRRYIAAGWLGMFLVLAYVALTLCLGLAIGFIAGGSDATGLEIFVLLLIPLLIFISFFPASRLLCEWFFPRRTLVRFTPQHITVNNQRYDAAPSGQVQFRASEPHLTQEVIDDILKLKERRAKSLLYQLKFRKIEMIYGSRIVPITSVADEKRAAQFAIALQLGHELAAQHKAAPAQRMSARTVTAKDDLPE